MVVCFENGELEEEAPSSFIFHPNRLPSLTRDRCHLSLTLTNDSYNMPVFSCTCPIQA